MTLLLIELISRRRASISWRWYADNLILAYTHCRRQCHAMGSLRKARRALGFPIRIRRSRCRPRDMEDQVDDEVRSHLAMQNLTFRGMNSEIYDLAWSPDGEYMITGCMDNTARIFSGHDGQCLRQIVDHNHYVQGVAWDPLGEYIATQSSDRCVS